MKRWLAAIVSTDIVGYSRLTGADEAGTLDARRARRFELIVIWDMLAKFFITGCDGRRLVSSFCRSLKQ